MVEPYQWLVGNAQMLGVSPQLCGPASVDLRLGSIKDPETGHNVSPMTFTLEPGFYLASTVEFIKVPPTHGAMVQMRSSWARRGLGHKMAGWVDPGFEGQVTLELEPSCLVVIPYAEPIVQVIFVRLTSPTTKPYKGRYQGQTGPTVAYVR